MEDSKNEEFKFVRPPYDWGWNITDIIPDNEKPPVLLVRNGEAVDSYNLTLSFLIEKLGVSGQHFVINPQNVGQSGMNESHRVYSCKMEYTAQLILTELRDKDFMLSDRVFTQKGWPTVPNEDLYGFPYLGATTTIGTTGHFLSFYWDKRLYDEYISLSFHNLERDLVHQQNREARGDSDPTGQKYLGCLESALELCKRTEEVPTLALVILSLGTSGTLSGERWAPAIFKELRHVGFSRNRTYGLGGVNISLDIEKIRALKEAHSRLTVVDSALREIIKDRRRK